MIFILRKDDSIILKFSPLTIAIHTKSNMFYDLHFKISDIIVIFCFECKHVLTTSIKLKKRINCMEGHIYNSICTVYIRLFLCQGIKYR